MIRNKTLMFLVFVVLIFLAGCSDISKNTQNGIDTETSSSNIKEFEIIAKKWSFSPSTIKVNKGDKVKLNIQSTDVTHGFALIEFGINENLNPGTTTSIEFIADKTGTFSFACSVQCGIGHNGMRGKLIVE